MLRYGVLAWVLLAVLLAPGASGAAADDVQPRVMKEVRRLGCGTRILGDNFREEIDVTLGRMEKANMNMMCPIIFSGSLARWNSEAALTPWREFPAVDRFAYLTEQAYKKGIEVHPVIGIFRISRPPHILPGTPGDAYRRFDKRIIRPGQMSPEGVCFHDDEYREFMAEITRELVENYKIHGLVLDLIRTGGRVCVCGDCVETYRAEYGRDLVEDSRKAGPEMVEWQEAGVGGLVRTVAETAKDINTEIKISVCAYIPASPSRRGMQGQVPHVWAEKGWIDFVFPMVYTDDPVMARRIDAIKDYQAAMTPDAVYPLLCLINRGGGNIPKEPEVVLEQIETVRREADVKGVAFYFHSYLTDETAEALGEGPFREKAVLPWRD